MTNIRRLIESDLAQIIEGGFAIPVILIAPNGERITHNTDGKPLAGRVLFSHKEIDLETGEPVIVYNPTVTLRESALPQVPKNNDEKWLVQIPSGPTADAPLKSYLIDPANVIKTGRNLGTITFFLVEVENSA